jgi:hypothetical protein
MAQADNIFGPAVVTPRGKLFFFDFDTPNTQAKHPKNRFPSDAFDVTLGFPKDTDLSELKKVCESVANQAFQTLDGIDLPFANGDEKSMDSMTGYIVIRAKCKKRPGLVDGKKARITEGGCDAGMWARIQVTPMSYTSGKSKGVTLILKNAQVLTDTPYDSLSGGASAENVFEAVDEDDAKSMPF